MFRSSIVTVLSLGFIAFAATHAGAAVPAHGAGHCHFVLGAREFQAVDYCYDEFTRMNDDCTARYAQGTPDVALCRQRAQQWLSDCLTERQCAAALPNAECRR